MLVITRKVGERLDLYHPATGKFSVEVRRVAGNRTTLACDAPGDVKIYRGELVDAAGGMHGVGTDSPEGNEAPPNSADVQPNFVCTSVHYGDCLPMVAASAKEAAEGFAAVRHQHGPFPLLVRSVPVRHIEPSETYRVEMSSDGPVALLISIATKLEASA